MFGYSRADKSLSSGNTASVGSSSQKPRKAVNFSWASNLNPTTYHTLQRHCDLRSGRKEKDVYRASTMHLKPQRVIYMSCLSFILTTLIVASYSIHIANEEIRQSKQLTRDPLENSLFEAWYPCPHPQIACPSRGKQVGFTHPVILIWDSSQYSEKDPSSRVHIYHWEGDSSQTLCWKSVI